MVVSLLSLQGATQSRHNNVLIVPFEPSPRPAGSGDSGERKTMDITSLANQDVVKFQLGYRATSQFVAEVSFLITFDKYSSLSPRIL